MSGDPTECAKCAGRVYPDNDDVQFCQGAHDCLNTLCQFCVTDMELEDGDPAEWVCDDCAGEAAKAMAEETT